MVSLLSEVLSSNALYYGLQSAIDRATTLAARDGMALICNTVDYIRNREVKSYIVSDSLVDALATVDCEEVGPWHFTDQVWCQHFLFKKNTFKDADSSSYNEMYISIMPPKGQFGRHRNSLEDKHKILIYLMKTPEDVSQVHPAIFLGARYKMGDTIEDILNTCGDDIGDMELDREIPRKIMRIALNLILYLSSADPEIMRLKPQVYNQRSFRENYFKKCKDERALLGLYSLGWDFHGREYHVSLGTRVGHMRWQRCGKQWSQVKLIYIQPTTVTYKTIEKG
jgi:hypothetical protein